MATILVVKLGALGDLLLADGALRDLRNHHRGDRIVLLTRAPFAAMMARCPWIDDVVIDPNVPRWNLWGLHRLAKQLRNLAASRVYDLQNSRRSAFYQRWLLPAAAWSSGECVSGKAEATPVLERHAAQLLVAGIAVEHAHSPCPDWLAEPLPATVQAQLPARFVTLLPGASARHRHKCWPGYPALARKLADAGVAVVSVPGPDEMHDLTSQPGLVLLDAGRPLHLPQLASVLLRSELVVGNDSGPTHLAAHLGCPGLALFGEDGPSPMQTGILRENFHALSAQPLTALSADTVHAAVCATLAERTGAQLAM